MLLAVVMTYCVSLVKKGVCIFGPGSSCVNDYRKGACKFPPDLVTYVLVRRVCSYVYLCTFPMEVKGHHQVSRAGCFLWFFCGASYVGLYCKKLTTDDSNS